MFENIKNAFSQCEIYLASGNTTEVRSFPMRVLYSRCGGSRERRGQCKQTSAAKSRIDPEHRGSEECPQSTWEDGATPEE